MMRPAVDLGRVRQHFSCHSEDYDRYAVVQKRVVAGLMERIERDWPGSGPVLDVGTGTGMLGHELSRRYPDLPLLVSDIAHGMTRHASGVIPAARPVDADAERLPFRSGSIGLVMSSSMYQWVNDLDRAFAECGRILKKNGRFAVALFGEKTLFELRDSYRRAAAECASKRVSHVQEYPGVEDVQRALSCAGFSRIEVETTDEVEYHSDVSALLRGLKKIGAQNAASTRPGGLASRKVMLRMMELYRECFAAEDKIPATYQVIYATAVLPG